MNFKFIHFFVLLLSILLLLYKSMLMQQIGIFKSAKQQQHTQNKHLCCLWMCVCACVCVKEIVLMYWICVWRGVRLLLRFARKGDEKELFQSSLLFSRFFFSLKSLVSSLQLLSPLRFVGSSANGWTERSFARRRTVQQ